MKFDPDADHVEPVDLQPVMADDPSAAFQTADGKTFMLFYRLDGSPFVHCASYYSDGPGDCGHRLLGMLKMLLVTCSFRGLVWSHPQAYTAYHGDFPLPQPARSVEHREEMDEQWRKHLQSLPDADLNPELRRERDGIPHPEIPTDPLDWRPTRP